MRDWRCTTLLILSLLVFTAFIADILAETEDETGTDAVSVNFSVISDIPSSPPPRKGFVIRTVNDKDRAPLPIIRSGTFTRDCCKTREITITVEDNETLEMEPLVMEGSINYKAGWSVWYYCICCLASLFSIVVLLMIIGLISRILKRSKRKHDKK